MRELHKFGSVENKWPRVHHRNHPRKQTNFSTRKKIILPKTHICTMRTQTTVTFDAGFEGHKKNLFSRSESGPKF